MVIERFQEYIALVMTQPRDHVMHLYASAVLIHARYVVIIMPAYTRHNEVLHGQSRSPLSSSLMTFHVHIIYVFPSFFYTSFVRTTYFRKKKKKYISRNSIYEKSLLEIYFQPVYRVHSFLPFYKLLFLPS